MNLRHTFAALALAGLAALAALADEPWRTRYSGEDATGPNVIALWQFQEGEEAKDASGNGHDLTLRGSGRFVEGGLFGPCLECFEPDKTHRNSGAIVKDHPALSPEGAFTIEMWLRPKPEFAAATRAFLIDKKYIREPSDRRRANDDYMIFTVRRGGATQFVAYLGYGEDSAFYESKTVKLEAGRWTHLAFTYDGKGKGTFYLDGKPRGETVREGRGPVAPGSHPLIIGDRVSGGYEGFPGYIAQVRILRGPPSWLAGTDGTEGVKE